MEAAEAAEADANLQQAAPDPSEDVMQIQNANAVVGFQALLASVEEVPSNGHKKVTVQLKGRTPS